MGRPWQRDEALGYRDWGRMGTNSEDPSERFGHQVFLFLATISFHDQVDGIDYDFKFLYGTALCSVGWFHCCIRKDRIQFQGF